MHAASRGGRADGVLESGVTSEAPDLPDTAGATAVQVGTATFNDPTAPHRVGVELEQLVAERGFDRLADVVGIAHERYPG